MKAHQVKQRYGNANGWTPKSLESKDVLIDGLLLINALGALEAVDQAER